ncbi:NAD(P)/FAD-dependent oxidoreductase [Thalassotalea sp. PS06]|uniref:NAD(P)/FAD-dependent oxidoreductase n=1 Tax=Thalassotalea sp. PS06 TaxID=2594005 RepID=UPI001164E435|nr:FAD-dependent oxidoreductase [Thalassotalea sp. PS06]QDP00111.1 FAD-dependent oxidoreductase [Thalassotalea sp. PS06]
MPSSMTDGFSQTKFFPYWLDSADRPAPEPELCCDIETELLIVGAGFTGLWAALQAIQENPNRQITVIEARQIAIGATGRPGAILSTSLMHGMENSYRLFAAEMDKLEQLGKENMDGFRKTIEDFDIDCDIEWGGELTVAVGEQGIEDIEREYQLYKRFGHDAHLLSAEQVRSEVNSPLFAGGLWSKQRSGTVNPAKLAWGLKRAAKSLGVTFYENTPKLKAKNLGDSIEVTVPNGKIRAAKVILATNAFTSHHKKISRRVSAIRDRILVTEPLTAAQLESIGWTNRQGVYDTRTQLNYMRLTKDNRLLFGGRLGYFYNNNTDPEQDKTPEPYYRLLEALHRTFPSLKGVSVSHAWSGPIALTTRMAVHYQRFFAGKMIYAGGYSGFGVTASRFAARVGLAIIDNKDIPETQLTFAKTVPGYIPPEPFRYLGAKLTMYALDTADEKGGWRIPWLKMVEKMGFPLKP